MNHLEPRVVHATWGHAALFSEMAHLSQITPGSKCKPVSFSYAFPVASQFSFKMSRKQVCVFVLTQPGPDLDLWPFTLGRVHVVHCHRAQTRVPWGVLILRKNSDGPGTSAS